MNAAALVAAVALYGFLSAPAPPVFRGVELAVGGLLALAVGAREPLVLAGGGAVASGPAWRRVGALALLWLAWAPLLRGLWLGWDAEDVVRDVVPLLFLFAPLALAPMLERAGPRAVDGLAAALMSAGLFFALRWWRHTGWNVEALGSVALQDGALYFLNAPCVLFAAVGFPLLALELAARGGLRRWLAAAVLVLAGAVCLGALAGAVHRLALVLALPVLGLAAARSARRSRTLTLVLAAGAAALVIAWGGALWGALSMAAEKSRQVGLNARAEEAAAALDQIGRSLPALLLGDGWGALLANPAVGGWRVSYTHTLFTYALVKTGLLGLAALAAWMGALVRPVLESLRRPPAVAALPALAMALTLHSSFKYLDTGLLLTLILACKRPTPRGEELA